MADWIGVDVSDANCAPRTRKRKLRGTPEEMFWTRVELAGEDECWLWAGSLNDEGYGRVQINRIHWQAHRLSWTLIVGAIPDGLVIDHLCRVRNCVNPAHLEPVTQRTNILRGEGVAAENARKTHCPEGHPYDARWTNDYRHCKRCKAEAAHIWALANPDKAREIHRASDRARYARLKAARKAS